MQTTPSPSSTANRIHRQCPSQPASFQRRRRSRPRQLLLLRCSGPPRCPRNWIQPMPIASENWRGGSGETIIMTLSTKSELLLLSQDLEICSSVLVRRPRLNDRYQEAISRQGSDSSAQQESFDADAWCEATGEPSRGRVYGFSIYKPASSIMPQYASQRHIGTSRYCSIIEEENRRYSQRTKVKAPVLNAFPMPPDDASQLRNVVYSVPVSQGVPVENAEVEFEAKSARDGAWYDVAAFLSQRMSETGDPEVRIRFSGFGVEEDEWVNARKFVRQRSLPCETVECIAVLPGDLILCFQEGKEQALYFDAHVLDAQRRRHDVRGCRCRFLVRYDNDQSEEIVPLKKICRRPETEYRLESLKASMPSAYADRRSKDPLQPGSAEDLPLISQRTRRQRKLMEVNRVEVTSLVLPAPTQASSNATQKMPLNEHVPVTVYSELPQEMNYDVIKDGSKSQFSMGVEKK
ncbi:hypothetical protein AXF42_Ash011289 [Apostasia shenzhenica]|uniref:SAWADEE domain-containing protein n=1 Tax=Apostasia shenzhenica TaxID=1088818 RepID=A0A2I0AE25_9ASPA|nr:hypothetical protein AXF42_Ash011289 [Apostasia shenzhenica]